MNVNIKLFNYFKNHSWNKIIYLLKETNNLDVNLRDENNNYLIQYSIIFNKIDILKILINKNCKLDIIDSEGKSLLFIPIKYNFINILSILLEANKSYIGESIIDIKDNRNYSPIHYCILNSNVNALKLLLNYKPNLNIKDNDGNNPLQFAILKKNIDIINILINTDINLNSRNLNGETALHIACNYKLYEIVKLLLENKAKPNITDFDNNLTPIIYSTTLRDIKICDLLIKYDSDINISDSNGNNALNHAIIENIPYLINLYLYKSKNLNSFNINGKKPLHLILDLYLNNNFNIDEIDLKYFIINTDLNSQDNKGNTILYLLVLSNLWKDYKNELLKKNLNIFIKNNKGKNILNIINFKDRQPFIDLVIDSYYEKLKNSKNNWNLEWENLCSKSISKNELKKKLPDIFNQIDKFSKNICKDVIKLYINKYNRSYPIKNSLYCVSINNYENVNFTNYVGNRLDILCGLLYLSYNYNNLLISLNKNFINNISIEKHYDSIGIDYKFEFLNFEILWSFQKIFFPTNLKELFKKFINTKKRFFIIPLGIELNFGSHANMIIYDKKFNEFERFEPNGNNKNNFSYNFKLLDHYLQNKFSDLIPKSKYISPNDFLPKISFQQFESILKKKDYKIGDPSGFCAAWSIWYTENRIKFPDIPRNILVLNLISKIRENNLSFKNLIRNFTKNIIIIRDSLLNKVNIDINDWSNQNISSQTFNILTEHIIDSI